MARAREKGTPNSHDGTNLPEGGWMKYISDNLDFKINPIISSYSKYKKIALTDHQILELQELFLASGLHYIAVPSLQEGRKLIYTFLKALRCFDLVGCFTKNNIPLKNTILNVHNFSEEPEYNYCMDELRWMTQDIDIEFLWVEYENNLKIDFFEKLKEYNKNKQIPILILCVDY